MILLNSFYVNNLGSNLSSTHCKQERERERNTKNNYLAALTPFEKVWIEASDSWGIRIIS